MDIKREYTRARRALVERVRYYEKRGYTFDRGAVIPPTYRELGGRIDERDIEDIKILRGDILLRQSDTLQEDTVVLNILESIQEKIIEDGTGPFADWAQDWFDTIRAEEGDNEFAKVLFENSAEIAPYLETVLRESEINEVKISLYELYGIINRAIYGKELSKVDRQSIEAAMNISLDEFYDKY